jgi:hypothetical protein
MRGKILVSLLFLPLAACIPVEDLGDYWAKAQKDPQLVGSWKVVEGPAENVGTIRRFIDSGDGFTQSVFDSQGKPIDTHPPKGCLFKTLKIGPYTFLFFGSSEPSAAGKREGTLDRYRIQGDTAEFIENLGPNWVEYVKTNYQNAANMKKNIGEGDYVRIIKFDDEVAKIISSVPDTEYYCENFEKLVRVR